MLDRLDVIFISIGYLLLLFGIAFAGERISARNIDRFKPIIIALAMTVYCSAWSFYGTSSQAVYNGWYFPPTFLGAIITLVVGAPVLKRLIVTSKRYNSTSIADFIASQYGRSQKLAILVTLVALIALLPYISLQLKAITDSFLILTDIHQPFSLSRQPRVWEDTAFFITLLLAMFTIMFGTRHIDSNEHHNGLMVAIAFEALVKMLAFATLGYYVCFVLFDGVKDLFTTAVEDGYVKHIVSSRQSEQGFVAATILGMTAIICLPRQYHVLVVESRGANDARTSRWLLPLYLGIFGVIILPIAYAGLLLFQGQGVSPEQFILRLPLNAGNDNLALLAYLGGLSAGSSMVILACVAISTMLCNEVLMPLILRRHWFGIHHREDISDLLRLIRRLAIIAVLLLSYLYYRWLSGYDALGSVGLLALSLVAQFAPAVIGALYWQHGKLEAVVAGILVGFGFWCYCLLLPTLIHAGWLGFDILDHGPLGLYWLRPQAMFGVENLSTLSNGVLWSLTANTLCYLGISLFRTSPAPAAASAPAMSIGKLESLATRFIGAEQAKLAFKQYATENPQHQPQLPQQPAEPHFILYVETLLAGVIGSASARHVINLVLPQESSGDSEHDLLIQETSQVFQFGRGLLQSSIDNISQGISVVDHNLHLVAWNKRYLELFQYPEGMVHVGRDVKDLLRYNAERGECGPGDVETHIARRISHMRRGSGYVFQRYRRNGMVLEIRGNPMPGGGYVTTYTDITESQLALAELEETKRNLEQRVATRTRELSQANILLHQADENKTRFLASASHDLIQPLNAAKIFISTLLQRNISQENRELIQHLAGSIHSAESLISELMDIAKLDAGAVKPKVSHFAIQPLLDQLNSEFRALAQKKQLQYRARPCRSTLYCDPQLLQRILQNLLANAVRYTDEGKILFGCRRRGDKLSLEVWDQGSGIPENQLDTIFTEFKRLDTHGDKEGLGLGLATVQRLCRLLNLETEVRSRFGKGSVFRILVPLGDPEKVAPTEHQEQQNLQAQSAADGVRVLCIDNEKSIVTGMQALLGDWGYQVDGYTSPEEAQTGYPTAPDILVVDYHLDRDITGIAAAQSLQRYWKQTPPCVVVSADRTDKVQKEAREAEFYFLPKPLKPAALRALLKRLSSKAPIS